jgi:hypothetical protein
MQWRRVGVYLLGTSEWQGQLHLRKQWEDTRPNTTLSLYYDSLLAYRLKISPAKNDALNYSNQACQEWGMETQGSSINRSERHLSVFRYNSLEFSQRKVTRVHRHWNRYFKYATVIIRCDSGPTEWLPVESVARGGTCKILQLNFQQALCVLNVRIHRQLGAVYATRHRAPALFRTGVL